MKVNTHLKVQNKVSKIRKYPGPQELDVFAIKNLELFVKVRFINTTPTRSTICSPTGKLLTLFNVTCYGIFVEGSVFYMLKDDFEVLKNNGDFEVVDENI